MLRKYRLTIAGMLALSFCLSLAAPSNPYPALWEAHPFYFGPLLGYGSTDWSMLIAHCDPKNPAECPVQLQLLQNSAPISAGDDGWVWGATVGYEVKPFWALESTFIRFPNTTVLFGLNNLYQQTYNLSAMRSTTWSVTGVAKFMTQIAHTAWRGFANAGIDFTIRNDIMNQSVRINPTFGVGLNYLFPHNIMLELAFQYVSGYGEADETPAEKYIPFLYSVHAKLLYRI